MNKHLTLGLILAVASQVNAMEVKEIEVPSTPKPDTTVSPLLSRHETTEEIAIRYINLERLCASIKQNNVPEVRKALALIKDVNATLPETKETPLHVAYHNATPNVEVVALLLARGANQMARDRHNQTPMDAMVQRWQNSRLLKVLENPFSSSTNLKDIKEIIAEGANPSTISGEGDSVLTLAINKDAYDIALFLIEKGTNVTRTYEGGNTALHVLATKTIGKNVEQALATAQALLNAGALLEAKNNLGQTPFDIAKSNYFGKPLKKYLKKVQVFKNTCNENTNQ